MAGGQGKEQWDLLDILALGEGALPTPAIPQHVPWVPQHSPKLQGTPQVDVPRCTV